MDRIAELLFQAHHLKRLQRTGYQFLGPGRESVAEHSYSATFVAYVLSRLEPRANALRLLTMCLVHDLPEAWTGDLNHVQKKYVSAAEDKAISDTVRGLPFEHHLAGLIEEFNRAESLEAGLAHDADQISFILELKSLADMGYRAPAQWLERVGGRLMTETGRKVARHLMQSDTDAWWHKLFS
jgi:putative hydrolase of HD superfamily